MKLDLEGALHYCDLAVRLDDENEKYRAELKKLKDEIYSKSSLCLECGSVHAAGQNSMCNLWNSHNTTTTTNEEKGFTRIKKLVYFGKNTFVKCDGNCKKAWGINSRPDKPDDDLELHQKTPEHTKVGTQN